MFVLASLCKHNNNRGFPWSQLGKNVHMKNCPIDNFKKLEYLNKDDMKLFHDNMHQIELINR